MKLIKSAEDLAINGAPPAFIKPLHVGGPNIGSRERFLDYVEGIFDRNWLTNDGPLVQELEKKIATIHDVEHCIAMSNGTIALEIAIRALELEGEVIVPSYTFIATAHALHWQAITPVFADIDPDTHNLDPEAVRRMITPRTSGIIGVHLWGRAAPVHELQALADEHGLKLMFDSAHAFACSSGDTMIGNFGACEVMSFHATKLFNTFEGGAVLTNDGRLADAMRLMRNFGFSSMDKVIYPGTNGKMIEIAAAMGLTNLEQIDKVIDRNELNHKLYAKHLASVRGIEVHEYPAKDKHNFQYVVALVSDKCAVNRDEIVRVLHAENVRARKYFWPGCHRMEPYNSLYPLAGLVLPNTESVADKVIVLPTGLAVDEEDIIVIASIIAAVVAAPDT